jgi:hypothetical protein
MTLNGSFTPAAPGAVPIVFNNQVANVTFGGEYYQEVEYDSLHGGSFEYDHALPNNKGLLTVSVDTSSTTSQEYEYEPTLNFYEIPPGSQEALTTEMLRAVLHFGSNWNLTLANYFNEYFFKFSNTNGATFNNQNTWYDVPRLGAVWQPNSNMAFRFAMGSGITPPYLYLLSSSTTAPEIAQGGAYATQTLAPPSGSVFPETSFGYNVGGDVRWGNNNVFTTDLYLNNIQNQFIQPYFLEGYCTGTCPGPNATASTPGAIPLYAKTVANLGNSRYAGIEFAYHNDPPVGIGGLVQGALIRAYAYNLGPCFYSESPGLGCTMPTANLGIVNYANFGASNSLSASGTYNTLGDAVPYAQGYAEIHYRSPKGLMGLIGVTYFGNNNSFQLPPFFIWNATLRVPILNPQTTLQASAYNWMNAYGSGYGTAFAGTPQVVLANGNFGLTNAKAFGPVVLRLQLAHQFGGPK